MARDRGRTAEEEGKRRGGEGRWRGGVGVGGGREEGASQGQGERGTDGDVRAYRAGLSKVQRNFHSWWACRMVWALFRAHVSWVSLGVRPRPDREWWMHYMRASAEFARARQHNPVPPFGPVVFTQNVK